MRGLLFAENFRPLFSGHETFALRQLWLKKAVELVSGPSAEVGARQKERPRNVFADDMAIVRLGVGKNMVASIRHWSTACDVINEWDSQLTLSPFGAAVFPQGGLDPFSEHASTLWLVHWKLAGGWDVPKRRTHRSATWYWVFNYIHEQSFSSRGLLKLLGEYAAARGGRISPATLKRDVEVCLRCYVSRSASSFDDFADSMLGELGLITTQGRDEYALHRGPKPTLTDGAFLYALLEFWQAYAPQQSTLSFETIAYEIGSPGRVFKLDEDSVAARLIALESLTKARYQWSDSAGLRQVVCTKPMDLGEALELAYV